MRRFLIVWFGQFISSIGSGLTAFALGIYIFQLTGSSTHYSLILLAAFLPAFILKPVGGVLADRVGRKWLMMIGDAGSALGLLFIIGMLWAGNSALWIIYLGTVISSLFVAVQNPAYKAAVTDLVEQKFYSKASGLMQLAESSRYLFSPLIAGLLLRWFDIKYVLVVDCASFIIAIISVFWATTSTKLNPSQSHWLKDLISGFQYVFSHSALVWLLSLTSIITFFIGLLQAWLGPMVLAFASSHAFGISLSVATSGMLIGSAFLGLFTQSTQKIPLLATAFVFSGLFFALMGIYPNIILVTLFGFLFFLTLPFVNTSLDVLVRKNVANALQGRVWAIVSLISQLGMVVAFAVGGVLADHLFNPLLQRGGALAPSLGKLVGVGEGRGIGLMFILSGLGVMLMGLLIKKIKLLRQLDA